MTQASLDLYSFVYAAARGICDDQDSVVVEIVESYPRNTACIIYCKASDLKFVHARLKEIRTIAISIAQRHHVISSVLVEE